MSVFQSSLCFSFEIFLAWMRNQCFFHTVLSYFNTSIFPLFMFLVDEKSMVSFG